jgi:hypothetical protein
VGEVDQFFQQFVGDYLIIIKPSGVFYGIQQSNDEFIFIVVYFPVRAEAF